MTEMIEANPNLALRPLARLIGDTIGRPVSHVTVGQIKQKLGVKKYIPIPNCPKIDFQ